MRTVEEECYSRPYQGFDQDISASGDVCVRLKQYLDYAQKFCLAAHLWEDLNAIMVDIWAKYPAIDRDEIRQADENVNELRRNYVLDPQLFIRMVDVLQAYCEAQHDECAQMDAILMAAQVGRANATMWHKFNRLASTFWGDAQRAAYQNEWLNYEHILTKLYTGHSKRLIFSPCANL